MGLPRPSSSSASMSPNLLARLAPPLFVLIWATGFIVARFVAPHAEPLTFLLVRYVLAIAVLAALVAAAGVRLAARQPDVAQQPRGRRAAAWFLSRRRVLGGEERAAGGHRRAGGRPSASDDGASGGAASRRAGVAPALARNRARIYRSRAGDSAEAGNGRAAAGRRRRTLRHVVHHARHHLAETHRRRTRHAGECPHPVYGRRVGHGSGRPPHREFPDGHVMAAACRAGLGGAGSFHRRDRIVALSDPSRRCHRRRHPALSGAASRRHHGLSAVRRNA